MNKKELICAVSQKTGMPKKDVDTILADVLDTVVDCLRNGEKVQLSGFGTFEMKKRAAKKARNPRTGDTVDIPETSRPAFAPGKDMKGLVK